MSRRHLFWSNSAVFREQVGQIRSFLFITLPVWGEEEDMTPRGVGRMFDDMDTPSKAPDVDRMVDAILPEQADVMDWSKSRTTAVSPLTQTASARYQTASPSPLRRRKARSDQDYLDPGTVRRKHKQEPGVCADDDGVHLRCCMTLM